MVFAAAFGAGAGITGMSVYSLSVLINPICDAFGWSRAEVSAAKTILTAGFVLTGPVVGSLMDRVGARRIGMVSLALLSLGMLAMTQIGPGIASFYLLLFVLSLAGCGTTALVWTRAVATCFNESRGLALSLTLVGPGIVGVITPQLLDALIQRFDWRAAYIAMAVFAALALVPVGAFFHERRGGKKFSTGSPATVSVTGLPFREVIRSRHFWQMAFAFLLIGSVVSALMVHLVPLITDAGAARTIAVRIASVLGVAIIIGRMLTGVLVDRFHPPYVAGAFLIMPMLGCFLILVAPDSTMFLLVAVSCIGLAAGSEVDLLPYLTARYFGLLDWGKICGWMFTAFYMGVAVGPPIFGAMHDVFGNYDLALVFAVPVLGVGAFAIMTLGRTTTA